MKVWFQGKVIPFEKAKISVLTHALHYGSGVFEGIRCYLTKEGPAVFRLKDHIKRFFFSAKVLSMKIPFSFEEILEAVKKTLKANNLKKAYIRPIAFFCAQKIGLFPGDSPVKVAIIALPFDSYLGEKPVKVLVSSFQRLSPKAINPFAKVCGYYVNSILATTQAKQKGFDEALLLDEKGYVAEGAGENIFFVKKNRLFTPKLGSILPGITRDTIIKIAKDFGIKTVEKNITLKEALLADEAFFCGTAAEVVAISQINKKLINKGKEGKITRLLKETYKKVVCGEIEKYKKWLDFV